LHYEAEIKMIVGERDGFRQARTTANIDDTVVIDFDYNFEIGAFELLAPPALWPRLEQWRPKIAKSLGSVFLNYDPARDNIYVECPAKVYLTFRPHPNVTVSFTGKPPESDWTWIRVAQDFCMGIKSGALAGILIDPLPDGAAAAILSKSQ